MPHLGDARRLARWIIGDDDADDVVQEALLRALRYFPTFSGTNGRGWLLTIVRNTARGWYARKRRRVADVFDEEVHSVGQLAMDPETLLLRADAITTIDHAMRALPARFRELLIMRELEERSYQEMADVLRVPIGTVMSGLSRARRALRCALLSRHTSDIAPASRQGGIDNAVHLFQERVDAIVLPVGHGELNRVA